MIPQNGHRLKVEKSKQLCVTSFAGLPLLSELAHQSGVVKDLDAIPDLWQRERDRRTSDYLLGLALTLTSGGDGLDDVRLLREDPGVKRLVFPKMPAANSLGEFLRRFGRRSLHGLGEAVSRSALRLVKEGQVLTLDIDSSLIESDKKSAKMTYNGFRGYNPVLAWLAEPNVFLAGLFREGNASPQSHIRSLLHHCRKRLPKDIELRFRSDSAGYRLDLMDYCHRNAVMFTITADLDAGVRAAIDEIDWKKAQLVVCGNDSFLLAETIYVPGANGSGWELPAFRLVVTRRTGQLDMFEDPLKYRAVITSFPESWSALEVLEFHNARGNAEKAIGELKEGFGLHGLPCNDLFANAAYFQTCLLAYNLVQLFKHAALPESWRSFGVKNLRFRLLCHGAIVVRHARRLILKLWRDFPFYDVFERARWAILSPALAAPQ
jgi:hypothetical protein